MLKGEWFDTLAAILVFKRAGAVKEICLLVVFGSFSAGVSEACTGAIFS
jgi:hypothetical protein